MMSLIKEILVSDLVEAWEAIPVAKAEGYEFLRIVGAATLGGAMIERKFGDIIIDLSNQHSLGTRSGGDDEACIAKLRAAR